MNPVEREYEEIANTKSWNLVFDSINKRAQTYTYTCIEAKKAENKHLNRYRDVNPFDHSRVVLKRPTGDYINANLIQVPKAGRKYILTQGPLNFTISHFWSMIWENKTKAILMLNKLIEKNEIKCEKYWPNIDSKMVLDDVNLEVTSIEQNYYGFYITRKFSLKDTCTSEAREILHFHYITWPDFGVPSSPKEFLKFLEIIRESGSLNEDVGPAVVHCSAGIGRSGTFCLVDSVLAIMENDGVKNLNIQELLLEMRKDRMGLIQTADQLRFSYQAIISGAKKLDPDYVEPEDVPTYENNTLSVENHMLATPPPPPPRGESLNKIPFHLDEANDSSSSSDGCPPTPPPRDCPTDPETTSDSSTHDPLSEVRKLRKRRNKELSEKIAGIKKRVKESEDKEEKNKSLVQRIAITVGFVLFGSMIVYYRHIILRLFY